jgi:hypothetical protein
MFIAVIVSVLLTLSCLAITQHVLSFDVKQRYQFKSIRVDFPEQILINEKAPAPHHVIRASIYAHNKP